MLNVSEGAKRLNCSIATVYQLVESRRLPHYHCPGIRVSEEQLTEFLETTSLPRHSGDKLVSLPAADVGRLNQLDDLRTVSRSNF